MNVNITTPNMEEKIQQQNVTVAHNCSFKPFGEVEKICTKCGYVIWVNKEKSDHQIIDDMFMAGYGYPDCSINCH